MGTGDSRNFKCTLLQSFTIQRISIPIPTKQFYLRASAVKEYEDVSRQRIALQMVAYHSTQPVNPLFPETKNTAGDGKGLASRTCQFQYLLYRITHRKYESSPVRPIVLNTITRYRTGCDPHKILVANHGVLRTFYTVQKAMIG
jgi:hypothetical protein